MDTLDRWLTAAEAAAYTGDDPKTVQIAAQAGELEGYQRVPGRSPWKFKHAALDRWVRGEKPAEPVGAR